MSIQSWTSVTRINLLQKCDFYFYFREKARGENYAEKISTEIGNLAATKDRAYSVKSYLERFAYIVQGESRKKCRSLLIIIITWLSRPHAKCGPVL